MNKFILSFAALTAAASLSAQISVATNTSTSAWNARATEPVFTTNSTSGSAGGVTANTSLTQTFTVSEAFSAESFHIRFRQGGNVGIAVYQVADANAATLSLGTEVFSANVSLPLVGANTTFADMTLDTPLALAAGSYAFQISTVTAATFEWRRTTNAGLTVDLVYPGDLYAGGRAYAIDPIAGTNSNFDAGSSEFSLAITAVPEPSTYAFLAGLFFLGFVALRRRRK